MGKRIRTLMEGDLDWTHLIEIAVDHRVAPLLYRNLWHTCPQSVPETIFSVLRQRFLANSARNMIMTRELFKILALFQTHRIAVMPFKGPLLAASAYGDLTLRQFDDLDLLVHREDMLKAKDLLQHHGFRPAYRMAKSLEVEYIRSQYGYDFETIDRRMRIEIHWHVTPRGFAPDLDPEDLWERSQYAPLGSFQIRGLSPEDQLLLLCVHGTKHFWRRLMWVCDIAELMRGRTSIHWPNVIRLAEKSRCRQMLHLGLQLSRELLGAPVPDQVRRQVQGAAAKAGLVEEARRQLFKGSSKSPRFLENLLFQMRAKDSLLDGMMFGLRRAVSPGMEDWMFLRLPSYCRFLYFLLRPLRLIVKHVVHPVTVRLSRTVLQVNPRTGRQASTGSLVPADKGSAGERA
ncbi:MAG: nucleotidyltransferase family protein [Anaerolineales bacterium]